MNKDLIKILQVFRTMEAIYFIAFFIYYVQQ